MMDADTPNNLTYIIKVVVYGYKHDTSISHSYLMDDLPTGILSIGELHMNIRTMTFKQLRPIIQYDRSNHMDKRSMMFQEAMFIMKRLPNYFQKPLEDWNKYQFGFIFKRKNNELVLIDIANEDKPISDFISAVDIFYVDLAIVPLSQIPPLSY